MVAGTSTCQSRFRIYFARAKELMKNIPVHKMAAAMILWSLAVSAVAAELKQPTVSAFDKYVAATERRISAEVQPGGNFLYMDRLPAPDMAGAYQRLKSAGNPGEKMKTPGLGEEVPRGKVHPQVAALLFPRPPPPPAPPPLYDNVP